MTAEEELRILFIAAEQYKSDGEMTRHWELTDRARDIDLIANLVIERMGEKCRQQKRS